MNRAIRRGGVSRRAFLASAVALAKLATVSRASERWALAEPGWRYEFPRDHRSHPGFKTEWWYFTGNVRDAAGRRFGFQLTFFRQGLRSPGANEVRSRFVVSDLKFAHFAVTDVQRERFHFSQKLGRGAFDEAGFDRPEEVTGAPRLAWIDDWQLGFPPPRTAAFGGALPAAGGFTLMAADGAARIAFALEPGKPWTVHGQRGISQKADGAGHASHYYSGTRMPTRGSLTLEGRSFEVTGETWFDHEWATNQLTAAQAGWDWFSLQFDDGTELMLYQLRLRDGGIDPNSSATFTARGGTTRHLTRDEYSLRPLAHWESPETRAHYPIEWELTIPALALALRITTPVRRQELVLTAIAYWEGVIDLRGTRAGAGVKGHGYMELTGYAGALVGLAAGVE